MADEKLAEPVGQNEEENESEYSEASSEELFYPYLPRIKMFVDIPPWVAVYAMTLLAYTFTAVTMTCNRR